MKRKQFILTATAAAVAVVFTPTLFSSCSRKKEYDPLIMPEMLGRFCDEDTIRLIGNAYLKKTPNEKIKQKLSELLLTDSTGKKTDAKDRKAVSVILDQKILSEFSQSRFFILQGWIISQTEARQCALFTLS